MAIDKTQATKCTKLIYVSPEANSNKFWCGWVMPSGDLYVEYGRINYLPRNHIYSCGSVTAASRKLASLVREKARKGYQEAILEANDVRRLDWNPFGDNANRLKQKLARIAALGQTIARHTSIQFDSAKGLFVTELGAISPLTVQKATIALERVSLHLKEEQSSQPNDAIGEYLALIPLPVGMKLNAIKLLGSQEKIQIQQTVLAQLDEGLNLIAQLRQEMLELAATSSEEATDLDRAWWVSWGSSDDPNVRQNPATEDERSLHISWS